MKRIVLTPEQMDRALGIEDCRHAPECVKRGRHVEHETARGVRWTGGDSPDDRRTYAQRDLDDMGR